MIKTLEIVDLHYSHKLWPTISIYSRCQFQTRSIYDQIYTQAMHIKHSNFLIEAQSRCNIFTMSLTVCKQLL